MWSCTRLHHIISSSNYHQETTPLSRHRRPSISSSLHSSSSFLYSTSRPSPQSSSSTWPLPWNRSNWLPLHPSSLSLQLKIDTITDNSFHLKQQNLMKKHQKEMDALHKRFEGSRGSHATQRHEGCMHLRHRNKIILTTFDSKHEEECSKIDIEEQVKKLLLHDSC